MKAVEIDRALMMGIYDLATTNERQRTSDPRLKLDLSVTYIAELLRDEGNSAIISSEGGKEGRGLAIYHWTRSRRAVTCNVSLLLSAGDGHGRALNDHLVAETSRRKSEFKKKAAYICLSSLPGAVGFYKNLGYEVAGATDKQGCVPMQLQLSDV